MLNKVLETVNKNNMLKAGDKVICALSGGADSMALLCVLYELKAIIGFELYAAHLNHSIRGDEADEDCRYIESFCRQKGIDVFVKKVDVPYIAKEKKCGEEEAGRLERYRFFDEVAQKLGGAKIATGHHKNDRVETVLFNLFRGSGSRGIRGIPYKRDNIIRPLLDVTKKEIREYLTQNNVLWREDYTNKDNKYSRNRIRNVILEEIEKEFSDAVEKIAAAADAISVDDEYLNKVAEDSGAFENGEIIAEKFVPLHESIKRRVILKALEVWGVCDVDSKKIKAVHETIVGQTGKGRDLGNNIRIVNNYGKVLPKPPEDKPIRTEQAIKVGECAEITVSEGSWRIKTVDKTVKMRDNKIMIILDADKMGEVVTVRYRKDGDYIYPFGMQGSKKLKKIFIDLKISQNLRDKISVLAEGNEVIFVPGIRKTAKYQPDENTKRYFVAEYVAGRK